MSTDALLMAALERGGDTSKTGRFLITYKEGAAAAGMKALQARRGLRVASAKDFASQAMDVQQAGDADAVMFPEIGVALVSRRAVAEHGLTTAAFAEEDAHAQSVDPEYFMFASQINPADYLKGVLRTAEMIAEAPAGPIQRYGIGYGAQIFVGKVLSNSGSGTQAQVLAGMNWAIANKCAVISMSLGAQIPVQPSYTAAGAAALAAGCLIIAAAGNASSRPGVINPAGAPANSPTVMSVAALDSLLRVAVFSNGGKIDIAGPGVNVFSSWPRPTLHNTISGTSMATPHVSGCAALWAQSNHALRGSALRAKLVATARHLPAPPSDVGAGLVQAP
jgi:subtilisin family serine protease